MKILFLDRDGTLVVEPADEQVDSLGKIRFLPGVFTALTRLQEAGFVFVMVTNQDGLGTPSFPQAQFEEPQRFILDTFAAAGIRFEGILICPHTADAGCDCRKPPTRLVDEWLAGRHWDRQSSAVIGDRQTDLDLAARLGIRGVRVAPSATPEATDWAGVVDELLARRATVQRQTKETTITVEVDLERTAPVQAHTGIGFFDHMLEQLGKHGGFSLQLRCTGDLQVDEHHTVEDCALALGEALRIALGDKRGIARYGFLLPMDEARSQVAIDLSGRAYAVFEGKFGREQVGTLPTELVPHFFRSLADSLGAAVHVSVTGENTHHMIEACFKAVGRALRQAIRREGVDLPSTKGVL